MNMSTISSNRIASAILIIIIVAVAVGVTANYVPRNLMKNTTSSSSNDTSNYFPVVFLGSGLPSNESWQVSIGGLTRTSNSSIITFWLPAGNYAYNVTNSGRYQPDSKSGSVVVDSKAFSVVKTIDLSNIKTQSNKAPDPAGIAFDPTNGYIYVADPESASILIIGGMNIERVINFNTTLVHNGFKIAPTPYGVAFNPINGYVYVTTANSSSVYVFDGMNLIASIPVATGNSSSSSNFQSILTFSTFGIAFDSANEKMYVTQPAAHRISVIRNLSVVSTIELSNGSYPANIAYNPKEGYMYVTSFTDNNITVLNNFSEIRTFSLGNASNYFGITYVPSEYAMLATIPEAGIMYFGSNSQNGTVPMPQSWTASYDPANELLYITAGYTNSGNLVYILNGTSIISKLSVGNQPWMSAYDQQNGYMYTTNHGSSSISILSSGVQVDVNFSES